MLHKTQYISEVDWDGLKKKLSTIKYKDRKVVFSNSYEFLNSIVKIDKEKYKKVYDADFLLFPDIRCFYENLSEKEELERLSKNDNENIAKVKRNVNHYLKFNLKIDVVATDTNYVLFKYSTLNYVLLPREFVVLEDAPNYDKLSYSEMNTILIGGTKQETENALEIDSRMNYKSVSSKLENAKKELENAENEAKLELKKFREEMERQEQALREKQETMLAQLRAMKEKFEDQIFILEMNIFALRSFFGETYSMIHIKKGKNAPENHLLQIYQKFRYLDEEFLRMTSLTDFNSENYQIENVFSNNQELLETFCPSDKCITFFKASKDNISYAYSKENDCLEMFKYLHGNQIGMLIRNGENVYLSFIDEEITLKDNLFVTSGSAKDEEMITEETKMRDKEARPLFNRKLIFIILQQIISSTNVFNELKEEQIFNSNKIRLTDADKQIITHKYPSFRECFEENVPILVDDEIFIIQNHAGSKEVKSIWGNGYNEEHRSFGYENRARDAKIEYGIGKISIIDKRPSSYNKNIEEIRYFVSCKRDIYDFQRTTRWDGSYAKVNNVNLRIYEDEFMSIMWINSNYPKEWIDSKNVGYWNRMNYTYLVSKLKELKEHLEDREKQEEKLLSKYMYIEYDKDMKDKVLAWRKANNIRKLTDYQAKRFAKYFLKNRS